MIRSALFDPTGRYRYLLGRLWDPGRPRLLAIMLNPSAADAERDDPTIRRVTAFARAWGFGALETANLFAFRTHSPEILRKAPDPVGPDNDRRLRAAARRAGAILVAWGNEGRLLGRDEAVLALLAGQRLHCLGVNRTGAPRHPLYAPAGARLRPFP